MKMELVLDANILFSALIKYSKTRELALSDKLVLYAPDYISEEFFEHLDELIRKTKIGKEKLVELFEKFILEADINIIPLNELEIFIEEAGKISPDPDDSLYFALALKIKCAIWSNDKKLKEQKVINVYSTEDLLEII